MDQKTRNLVTIIVVGFALGYFYHSATTPKKPIKEAIARVIDWGKWLLPLAPLMLDEGPPEIQHQELYSALPPREVGADGHEQLDFSQGW